MEDLNFTSVESEVEYWANRIGHYTKYLEFLYERHDQAIERLAKKALVDDKEIK